MAFVCTINGQWAQVVGIDWTDESTLIAGIGYDDALPISYSVVVSFAPAAGELEFVFYIAADSEIASEVRQFWCGKETPFIQGEDRKRVLETAANATRALALHCNPRKFFMITYSADLPPRALVKSELLCDVFTGCGYRVSDKFEYHGKVCWSLERDGD
ncbi:hypothetical protein [Bosea sp. (in: a-proteobacteria)]|uniref:hypothetical protein n=1 Tax=Bosea sp. (in: a-proteobacteria) TaxID=1871050 RepID=UPI0011FD8430|nr:hypothetical protein [Bosea sp. (in: a-proteobacteria)]TAJ30895.1 MAG: hypothetical protein EPO59_09695 [Bosea sp. (in: a-proteobacteria)]